MLHNALRDAQEDDTLLLDQCLAKGGLSEVWLGHLNGEIVSVKKFRHDSEWTEAQTSECLAYFLNEAKWLSELRHPNLIRGLGTRNMGDQLVILLQFIPGVSLRKWLDTNIPPRDISTFFTLARGVTTALHYLHQQGLMHRDVAPRNVMVTPDHETILLDLQFVREASATSVREAKALSTEIGSWAFAAPELMGRLDETYDGRVDIYSLGALLIELLVGRPPRRRQPAMCRPDVPLNLSDLLWRMVSEVPDERPMWEEITAMFIPPAPH